MSSNMLSDDEVAEIEAEDHAEMCGDALYCDCGKVTRDALCATVRALRAERLEIQRALASSVLNDPTEDDDLPYSITELVEGIRWLIKMKEAKQKRNTALREQLARRQNDCHHNHIPLQTWLDLKEQLVQESQQRGLVIMSALINFVDWLDSKDVFNASEKERGKLVKQFLAAHSEGENYFKQADQIVEILGAPFKQEQP